MTVRTRHTAGQLHPQFNDLAVREGVRDVLRLRHLAIVMVLPFLLGFLLAARTEVVERLQRDDWSELPTIVLGTLLGALAAGVIAS